MKLNKLYSDPVGGNWYAAEDIDRMVLELDIAMNGENAAEHPLLCDLMPTLLDRIRSTAQIQPEQELTLIPLESSKEAAAAIKVMLAEYVYPPNPTNAARAGWKAARLYKSAPTAPLECKTDAEKTAHAFGWFKALEEQRKAQQVQEPVAWLHPANSLCVTTDPTAYARGIPLYTHPAQAQPVQEPTLTGSLVDHMVNRFLGWKLPSDFTPDCGITFKRESDYNHPEYGRTRFEPIGTNLFTADQAKAMFAHCMDGYAASPAQPVQEPSKQFHDWAVAEHEKQQPALKPLTQKQRYGVFDRAEERMKENKNLSWRNAIIDEIESVFGIKEQA